jgi:putative methyltransferase (TIGR04325 family)
MHPRLKRAAVQVLPPILATAIKRSLDLARRGGAAFGMRPSWEMVPDSADIWERQSAGWSHGSIVETQCRKWQDFLASVDGARPLGQSHEAAPGSVPDVGTHNTIMSFAYALGRAAAGRQRVSVLDWGGGIGHYFVYARRLYPEFDLDYVIKDLQGLCEAGRERLPEATFVSESTQALMRRYDFVFASSSLHYVRDCYALLDRLCASAGNWLMVTRTPFLEMHEDFVVVQRPHMFGYITEYPGWFLNRKRFIDFVTTRGFSLDREFLVAECPHVPNAFEQGQYRGFLFRRTDG